ncbi:hypothetical protein CKM354_000443400 [Cercospora kikuchii]|uniref:Uncharacterized protein n=1 Tax=Cercospora kikuchii TaxID=84275 RepID=A0A9P3FBH6_9PEZI|nr:uncharacterized protein CKM354_000443400 [Cercospora kikuchii]GIZ41118.1 hypothetical protein CKM354_000443400 [Cercospora kikuchii]
MNEVKSAGSDTTTEEDTTVLRDHLENLPQELYDMIYDLTFTAKPEVRVIYLESARPVGDEDPTSKLEPGGSIHRSLIIVFGIVMLDRLVKAMDKKHVLLMRLYLRDESGGYDGDYQDVVTRHESTFACARPYVRFRGLEETLKREFGGR